MKNIFIVTDFSEASQNAGRYGIEMAKYFNANVFLFHAYQVPVQVPESYFVYSTEDVWANVKGQLETEAATINPDKLINVEICGAVGLPVNLITEEATKREADLIICGMKGMGKTFRRIFGSTTTALSRKSEIPMIVVPENAKFQPPKNIALANDMDPETSALTYGLLKELGEKFVSKLSVVWVVDEGIDVDKEMRFRPKSFINELKDLDPVLEFPSGSSVIAALDGFIKDHSIDLMAIIPHKHDAFERFITESVTKKMLFHTHIPMLILPQRKKSDMVNEEKEMSSNKTA